MGRTYRALDVAGNLLEKGDTVTTLAGSVTARVCDVSFEQETAFVRLRPTHTPYAKGIWHAADRVLRLAVARKPAETGSQAATAARAHPSSRKPIRRQALGSRR